MRCLFRFMAEKLPISTMVFDEKKGNYVYQEPERQLPPQNKGR